MTREEVKQRLALYRVEKARLDGMKIERRKIRREKATFHEDRLETLAGAGAQNLTGMPGAHKVESTVEKAAIKLIDEPAPEELAMQARIDELDRGIDELTDRVELVEAWIDALNDREKTVVWARDVMGVGWAYVAREWEIKFGFTMSDKALQIAERRGIDTICKAAEFLL